MQWATKIFLIAFLIPVFLFAKVEIVNVEVEGLGSSKKAAIDSSSCRSLFLRLTEQRLLLKLKDN